MNWYWLGAFIINDLILVYTGYLIYKKVEAHLWGADVRVLHCSNCGHPEVVPLVVGEITSCEYCTPSPCEDCETDHVTEDLGFIRNPKFKAKKLLKSSVKK